jgi:hypothetical protein
MATLAAPPLEAERKSTRFRFVAKFRNEAIALVHFAAGPTDSVGQKCPDVKVGLKLFAGTDCVVREATSVALDLTSCERTLLNGFVKSAIDFVVKLPTCRAGAIAIVLRSAPFPRLVRISSDRVALRLSQPLGSQKTSQVGVEHASICGATPGCAAGKLAYARVQSKVEGSQRTFREQLFRFLWRARPLSNTATAVTAGTTTVTEPYERPDFSRKEQT